MNIIHVLISQSFSFVSKINKVDNIITPLQPVALWARKYIPQRKLDMTQEGCNWVWTY